MKEHPAVKPQDRSVVDRNARVRRGTVLVIIACVAVLSLGLSAAIRPTRLATVGADPPTGSSEPHPQSSPVTVREIERLHRRVNALTLQLANQQVSIRAPTTEASNSPPELEPEPMTVEQERQQVRAATDEVQQRFSREPRTSSWAAAKQEELRGQFQRSALGRVTALDCRGAMCRVEMEHASVAESMSFLDENELEPGLRGTRYVRFPVGEDGKRYVLFIEPADPHQSSTR